jgi:7,8-dihydro-6-hydroxymethylpterin-pyrophosphokinase
MHAKRETGACCFWSKPSEELILPHPRMSERAFVLAPLAEVAPDWRHPVLGLRVSELLDQLPPGALDGLTPLDPQVAVKLKTS